ncbi:MAG: magnesium transporter [Acholeplasma sp.]|nr:magnesium transporter [Acholeplasma sp.]
MKKNYSTLTLDQKKAYLLELHAFDLKELYESLDEDTQKELFDLLMDDQKADLLAYLNLEDAIEIVEELDTNEQADILSEMEPDDAIDILNELEPDELEALMDKLEPELKEDYYSLAGYEDDETGSIMTNSYLEVSLDMEVKSVMKYLIEHAPLVETINKLYVVDRHETFIGVLPLKKLIKAKSPSYVKDLYEPSLFVYDKDDKELSVDYIQENGLNYCPVLNERNELVGIISLDDAIDTYEEEMIENFQKMSILNEENDETPFKSAFKRLPWLVILLLLAMPIARLALSFESILQTYTIIVILQPLILSMVGNAGTQTLTFSLIMLSDDEPKEVVRKNLFYEVLSAILSGFLLSTISFIVTILFILINPSLNQNPFVFGSAVGLSVWVAITVGTLFSSLIPIGIKKIGLDPSSASGPLITTMIDISTIVIYYGIASLLVGVFL